jgi:hypothetical protein
VTINAPDDKPATGVDVQKAPAGVFGNAVWLIFGPDVTVVSTIDCNSVSVGKCQPEPSRVSPVQ